ncbi:hypothetical protein UREG_01027 [Uncinocarpus reesii 1704]|uniref:FK506-binding protein n=1 Tax=Uncinocarpus reesii (strain UAMH 1704) TaxID=336963 RepID=C4JFL3_UNCRE|nr:uncharacterized protein UREG_01027 [Uncinocarpus reesii 1704]EEP76178.1 hypothetical protein UREG_01027 [Uncinocarpus reesii 1704]
MAAIDPDALPEYEDEASSNKPPRATLRIIRAPPGVGFDEDDEDDSDYDLEDDDESSDDEANGGPSDLTKAKLAKQAAKLKEMEDAMDEDDSDSDGDDVDLKAAISKLIKGKDKVTDDDGSESSEGLELDEAVVCTLDPEKHYQQPLDFVITEDERVFFKVTGTHAVYLTGNFVVPLDQADEDESDEEDDDYDDYDLSPDEDELALMGEIDEESDDLDDMANPRIMEIDTDDDEKVSSKAPKKDGKGKNKRPAEDSEENLDDMMSKTMKPATNGEPPLSKKQQKKLKKNNGQAVEAQQQAPAAAKTDKKVQFAKNLEQGPSGSAQQKKEAPKQEEPKSTVKEVQGVKIEDKKTGKGPVAKKGNRVSMRYIGKLENGKVFDSNKKGKPFSFKIGAGEVIKGWDIGIPGMAVGSERRITVPSHLAYGKSSLPGIPANSKLIFDVKLLEIK